MNISGTISEYEQFCKWTYTLHQLSENEWHSPIREGKASIAEIIAHLRNWDLHLINVVIPSIKKGEGMEFPNFDSFNSKAFQYANSGVSKEQLLQEFSSERMKLIEILNSLKSEDLLLEVTANGVLNCPKTGTPYSLLYIIQEFTEHDDHHKKQILSFLD
ncbi:DinB family protein [Paenibacillus frigoriresistens]|uniref:DinB family protein n=1 Tax=Paenibacillus alginolyticus TaxID=59839 RepID=UPI00156457AB|nr:DinB family protein [Paenibacillus frigoriresistens]NRF95857.1 DinB family protein [Paenibacillus frigoriresistens]